MFSHSVPAMHPAVDVQSRVHRDSPPTTSGRHTSGDAQSTSVPQRSSSRRVPPVLVDDDVTLDDDAVEEALDDDDAALDDEAALDDTVALDDDDALSPPPPEPTVDAPPVPDALLEELDELDELDEAGVEPPVPPLVFGTHAPSAAQRWPAGQPLSLQRSWQTPSEPQKPIVQSLVCVHVSVAPEAHPGITEEPAATAITARSAAASAWRAIIEPRYHAARPVRASARLGVERVDERIELFVLAPHPRAELEELTHGLATEPLDVGLEHLRPRPHGEVSMGAVVDAADLVEQRARGGPRRIRLEQRQLGAGAARRS